MKIAITLAALALLNYNCGMAFNTIKGSGHLITENRNISGFTKISDAGSMDVELTKGSSYKIVVEADDNLMQYIVVEKEGDQLSIRMKDHVNVNTQNNINIKIEMPELRGVSLSGSGNVKTVGTFTNDGKMEASLAGSGNLFLNLDCPEIKCSIASSGNTTITGNTKFLDVSIAGSGDFIAPDLKSERAKVSIAGSGDVKLFASVSLDVSIVGSGDVYYGGSPNISKSVIGSGKLRQAE